MTHRRRVQSRRSAAQSWLDYRPPRHQTESHAVIEQRIATAGEHDRAPVDAGYALPVCDVPMLQSAIGGNVLGGLRQLPIAQRFQQIPGENQPLPAPLGQPLFFEEVGALLQGLPSIAAKAQVAQSLPPPINC